MAEMKTVFERYGERTVITGWRAWLIALPIVLVAAVILVAMGLLVVGTAISIATIILFALPLAIIILFAWWMLQPLRAR